MSETLPSTCNILFHESSIGWYIIMLCIRPKSVYISIGFTNRMVPDGNAKYSSKKRKHLELNLNWYDLCTYQWGGQFKAITMLQVIIAVQWKIHSHRRQLPIKIGHYTTEPRWRRSTRSWVLSYHHLNWGMPPEWRGHPKIMWPAIFGRDWTYATTYADDGSLPLIWCNARLQSGV